jgi:2-dehydro-3-deoxyphosphogluconate aldolase/(4S)-4-hydroxy-2-oxoglutarate aldolase
MPEPAIADRIIACGIMPIVRMKSIGPLLNLAEALLAGGLRMIEVSMGTPGALEGIEQLSRTMGDGLLIGVGTVLSPAMCRDAISAGAQFVVSPHLDAAIVAATKQAGKASLPGAFTPTEIVNAMAAGADLVKVFPSTQLGPDYIRELLAPLPHLRLMPTGGVTVENAADWFRAGAMCLGVGSGLFPKEAVESGDWERIRSIAREFAEVASTRRLAAPLAGRFPGSGARSTNAGTPRKRGR